MRESSNPVLNTKAFNKASAALTDLQVMTVKGTVQKTILMALLVLASAMWSWSNPGTMWMMIGGIGGFIAALVTIFKPTIAPISAPIYAVLQGLFLGSISFFIGSQSGQGGLVMQAITLTIGVLFLMLFLYSSGIIKVTEKLKMGVFAATGAVGLMYMINFIMSFFGAAFFTLEDTSVMAIGINLVIVGVAAFNLLLDFDFIDKAAAARAPKAMEWFGAFGLMVTLIWLYIELLKLLSRLNRN
ncbi:MAG: putative YccA/Bax inhibitor family protein [Halieaceae bacterium]|jgi:uncharacterized YccA/Bax inhibitor family protein